MFAVIIPTYNAGDDFAALLSGIAAQSVMPKYKVIVDSSSSDNTVRLAQRFGWTTEVIPRQNFNHGATRQTAWQKITANDSEISFIVFMTQDVRITNPRSFEHLLASFADSTVGAAYGRQLPHIGASPGASLQRQFSYGAIGQRKTMADAAALGIRAPFLSDSFAAYRVTALNDVGGFPVTDLGEDIYVGGKMLLNGWAIQYEALAEVYHSHDFSPQQSWRRYRSTGAFYRRNAWLEEHFGRSEGAGLKLLRQQISVAVNSRNPFALATMLLDDAIKYLSYSIGYRWGKFW